MYNEQNIIEIMDTCPNFTHTLLHDPQPHQETQHLTNLKSPPQPL